MTRLDESLNASIEEPALANEPTGASAELTAQGFPFLKSNDAYAIFTIDTDGRIISWSDGAAIFYGHRPPEIVGEHFASTYAPGDRMSGQHEKALAIARTKGSFREAGWRVRKDGSSFWAHINIDALRDEQGNVVGFANVTRDLTVLQRKAGLLQRVKTLEVALNNMSPGMVIFDADERMCLWNANWKLLATGALPLLRGTQFVDVIRSSLESQGQDARSEDFAPLVAAERERHLARLARAGDATVSDVVQADGRIRIHRHRALLGGGWITTIEDVTGILREAGQPTTPTAKVLRPTWRSTGSVDMQVKPRSCRTP